MPAPYVFKELFSRKKHNEERQYDPIAGFCIYDNQYPVIFINNAHSGSKNRQIFTFKKFQQLLKKQDLLEHRPVADPFVIAKAKVKKGVVVTSEGYRPDGTLKDNAHKIPNICKHFDIGCMNLNSFMEHEQWEW